MVAHPADPVSLLQRVLRPPRRHSSEARAEGVVRTYDFNDAENVFGKEILAGLLRHEKSIPWTTLFDSDGLQLFEQVCAQPEYLASRIERAILGAYVGEIVDVVGTDSQLIALGSHGNASSRLLIETLRPSIYVPVDGSRATLEALSREFASLFPRLNICGLNARLDPPLHLPRFVGVPVRRTLVCLLGAAFARFPPAAAPGLLTMLRELAGPGGRVLVSVDQTTDGPMLEGAFNDKQGAMAAFNVNALLRINRELQGDFQHRRFAHVAGVNRGKNRLEMSLESQYAQFAHVSGKRIDFAPGERIRTAIHCTYNAQEFQALARTAGLRLEKSWSDTHNLFAVHCLVPGR